MPKKRNASRKEECVFSAHALRRLYELDLIDAFDRTSADAVCPECGHSMDEYTHRLSNCTGFVLCENCFFFVETEYLTRLLEDEEKKSDKTRQSASTTQPTARRTPFVSPHIRSFECIK